MTHKLKLLIAVLSFGCCSACDAPYGPPIPLVTKEASPRPRRTRTSLTAMPVIGKILGTIDLLTMHWRGKTLGMQRSVKPVSSKLRMPVARMPDQVVRP
jgi:hypothetical protein